MRSFIIFGFLAAAANAAVLPGYQYGPGVSGSRQEYVASGLSGAVIGQGSSFISSGSGIVSSSGSGLSSSGSSGSGLASTGGYSSGIISSAGSGLASSGGYSSGIVSSAGSGLASSNSAGAGLSSYGGYSSSNGAGLTSIGGYTSSGSSANYQKQSANTLNIGLDALDSVPQTVEFSKQFYHFDAPEEVQEEGKVTKQLSNVLKKNLQVVFIKAPENNAVTNAALQLAKQAIEQRTAIYVLSKQQDGAQLVGQLQQIQENVQTAPEVKFVKYRTAEDVQRAKAEIQAEYDNFGGAAENFDGGVAPVLNYASAGSPSQIIIGGSNSGAGSQFASGSKYASTQLVSGGKYQSGSISSSGSSHSIGIGSLLSSSSSNKGSSSVISDLSYLPPTSLKK